MYNKNNLAVARVALKSGVRPELKCVAFYGDRTVATDAFRAIEVTATGETLDTPILYFADALKAVKLAKGEQVENIPLKPAEGVVAKYPSLDTIWEDTKKQKYATVKVNAQYLADICEALKGLDPFKSITLKVPIDLPYKPIIIEADNTRGPSIHPKQTARALLMPMNH